MCPNLKVTNEKSRHDREGKATGEDGKTDFKSLPVTGFGNKKWKALLCYRLNTATPASLKRCFLLVRFSPESLGAHPERDDEHTLTGILTVILIYHRSTRDLNELQSQVWRGVRKPGMWPVISERQVGQTEMKGASVRRVRGWHSLRGLCLSDSIEPPPLPKKCVSNAFLSRGWN